MAVNDSTLIKKIHEGNLDAFEALYKNYCKRVYGLAYQMLGNHLDADEVLQETFIRVYEAIANLRETNAFATWLYRITTRLCFDHLRTRRRNRNVTINAESSDWDEFKLSTARWVSNPEQVLENKELLETINLAIEELPARQKAVVILHEVEGFSKKQIAEILSCPLATVRSNLHYAREKLKKKLMHYVQS